MGDGFLWGRHHPTAVPASPEVWRTHQSYKTSALGRYSPNSQGSEGPEEHPGWQKHEVHLARRWPGDVPGEAQQIGHLTAFCLPSEFHVLDMIDAHVGFRICAQLIYVLAESSEGTPCAWVSRLPSQ
jgi:hypothetical protein